MYAQTTAAPGFIPRASIDSGEQREVSRGAAHAARVSYFAGLASAESPTAAGTKPKFQLPAPGRLGLGQSRPSTSRVPWWNNPEPVRALLSKPYALARPSTLNPQPPTLNPQLSTFNLQPSTHNLQPSTLNPHQLYTGDPTLLALNLQNYTLNLGPWTLNPEP
jgi:hypothetical protein